MSRLKRRWVCWGLVLGLAVVALLGGFWLATDVPVRYVDEPDRSAGPLACRLVLNDRANRLVLAYQDLPTGRLRAGRIPPPRNPLVMSPVLARVEVENTSGQEFAVFSRSTEPRPGVPPDAVGEVTSVVEDEAGEPITSDGTRSLMMLYWWDKHTGAWVSEETRTAPQRPVLRLAPGQVLTYRFHAHPGNVRPGTYTIRAFFHYHEAPGGALRTARSNAIAVRVTQADLDEWDRNVGIWVWGL